ncbi:MAG TPA: hypothetical protein VHL79_09170 [Ramlibacter sp.]|jgi:hypothetical protein|nr:hypothetical protein [Ramlibacter sp.]
MNIFRQFAWAAVVASTVPASTISTVGQASEEARQPADRPGAAPPEAPPTSLGWLFDDDDAIDDEFEGDGWGFWGL